MAARRSGRGLGRAAAELTVRLRWWVIGFWLVATLGALLFLPTLSETHGRNDLRGLLPDDTPAIQNELREFEQFGFPLSGRTVVVQRDPDGLTVYDQARTVVNAAAVLRRSRGDLGRLRGALPISNALGVFPGAAETDTTTLTYLLFEPGGTLGSQTRTARRYAESSFGPRDSVVGVTGSVPARTEQARILRDALPVVETLTLGAILLIVGGAFRSLVAPLVAAFSTGIALALTLRLSGTVADLFGFATPSELEPVIVALLLGIVTDYVVFYLTGYRRELVRNADRVDAGRVAAARTGPIVVVAGLAVAAGAGALLVADTVFFRALGPALVFTVLMGLVVAVTLVPAVMTVLGKWVFWPGVPEVEYPTGRTGRTRSHNVLHALANRRRLAGFAAATCVTVLLVTSLGVLRLELGVSFVGSLPEDSGVRRAADAARAGFAPGILSPTTVLVEGRDLDQRRNALVGLQALIESQPGVAGVLGPGDLPTRLERGTLLTGSGDAARFLVVLDDPALGAEAIRTVDELSGELSGLLSEAGLPDARAGLGGDTAAAAYVVEQTRDDMLRIAIAALVANLFMLVLFLRAVVAALYLLLGSVLSLGATLGITMLVFGSLQPGAGLTFYVPFCAAVLLLAFGNDYNIYVVGNVWEEARSRPLPEAITTVMPSTVRAIIVAGMALAASFGLLAVVPLAPFRQLAFMMALGILIDVVVVRSLLLPSMLTLVGRHSAWPSRQLLPADPAGPEPAPPGLSSRRTVRTTHHSSQDSP